MTTLTAPRALPAATWTRGSRVVRSEWIKLTSLRSTAWSLAIMVTLGLGVAVLMAATVPAGGGPTAPAGAAQEVSLAVATVGFSLGQLVAAVLGALSLGGEYSTGMVRSTFAAVPRRLPVLWAKVVVLFLTVSVVAASTALLSWAATYAILDAKGLSVPLGTDLALALLGGAAYLGLVAAFGLGVGAAVRSSAGAITLSIGILLVLPTVVAVLGTVIEWTADMSPYLLSSAGGAMSAIPAEPSAGGEPAPDAFLAPAAGAAVAVAWSAAALAAGAVVVSRRDV